MLEIIAFVAIAVYTCTLPARIRRALGGQVPAKFKGDSARYLVNLRRESAIIAGCSAFWAAKDIADVLWLRTDGVADSGTALVLWAIIAGWLACAAGAFIARRSLTAASAPSDSIATNGSHSLRESNHQPSDLAG
jgi:hypothetical protein